ncbi:hypothetical protein RJ639_028833 [Escallonia herrerae]|uniref:Uncharacterized protein n=1 Tax=Escallonia herrerae TaxID=1293975 RepID=A0AA88X378_9ASTE|nr:hypothetical protein RJ639_028833 [Escallonia herrerae]
MGADWGPVVVAVVMFILLSPGLLFQLPARTRVIEFGNMYTSGIAILVHAVFQHGMRMRLLKILHKESHGTIMVNAKREKKGFEPSELASGYRHRTVFCLSR